MPDELEQVHRAPLLGDRARAAKHAAKPALLALSGDEHVLEHRQAPEQPRQLERPPHAEPEHPVRWGVGDLHAVEAHLALLDPLIAGDDVEQRRLARAVGTDQAVDLSLADLQATVRQRVHAAERLRHAADFEQRTHRTALATPWRTAGSRAAPGSNARARRLARYSAIVGTTPRGSSRITPRNSTP